ncbi:MAG: hypothetical protein WC915_06630 [archaeon]
MVIIGCVLLVVILVWGLIGSSQSAKIGTTCDFGIGEDGSVLCWTWHKNIIGDIQETFDNFLDEGK